MNFLTEQEIKDNRKAENEKFALVGQTSREESWFLDNLNFRDFPVKWSNSSDLLYQYPYEDDFLTALSIERAKRLEEDALRKAQKPPKSDPWTYQDGWLWYARYMRESPKALMVRLKGFGTIWAPKSQIDFEDGHPWGEIWLPLWLMRDKGLEPDDAPPELNPPFEWDPALLTKGKVKIPPRSQMKLVKTKE